MKRGRCVDEGSYKHDRPKHPYHYDYDDHYDLEAHRRTPFCDLSAAPAPRQRAGSDTRLVLIETKRSNTDPALCPGAGAGERSQETL